ncbi:PQQ-binding-like beta-propeller repeat protein [Streptomyces sp. NPDC091272]|uniref:serine/threonine-protein kinase n=1 Tax=Streptomyces sp. NPDC091272 TaxID=3365981 RepID=UPI0037FE42B1
MSLAADDPRVIGDYRLLGRLGTGGMGTVYLGASPSGREVAVKVIHEQYSADPDFRTRFRQEIAAARRVSGAFTAAVLDADPDAVRPWMATQYVPGPTLAELLDAQGPLAEAELRLLALGLVEALRDIHRVGVVHRDLKPANVLMAHDGPRVIDFGVSRAVGNRALTVTGHVMGTPPFMSPEQLNSPRTIGPASDVFSLATLLVYAAVGRGPFDADSPYMTAYQVVHEPPVLDGLREPLRGILEYCLLKEAQDRPETDELAALLRKWKPGSASGAGPGAPTPGTGTEGEGAALRVRMHEGDGASKREGDGVSVGRGDRVGAGGGGVRADTDTGTVVVRRQVPVGDRPTPPPRRRSLSRRARFGSAALVAVLGAGGLVLFLNSPGDQGPGSPGRSESDGKEPPAVQRSWQTALPTATGAFGPFAEVRCTLSGNAVHCGGGSLRAVRLDVATGSTRWRAPEPPTVPGTQEGNDSSPSAAAAKGAVVFVVETVSDSSRRLAALDTRDGHRLWHRPVGGYDSPAVLDDLVVTPDAARRAVVARDPRSGATRWSVPNPAGQFCSPFVLEGQLYGSCARPDDGAAPRSYVRYAKTDGRRAALVTRGRDHDVVGAGRGLLVLARWGRPGDAAEHANHEGSYSSLLLVDPTGARAPRTLALPGAPKGRPVLLGDTVYFVHHWGTVSAYDVRTGAPRWSRDPGVRGLGVPGTDAAGATLFVPSLSGQVLALNSRTGKEVWRSAHRGAPPAAYHDTAVLRAGGLLVVTGTSGEVFALDPKDPGLRPGNGADDVRRPGGDAPPPPPPPRSGSVGEGGSGGRG